MGADVLVLFSLIFGLVIEVAFLRVRVVRCQRGLEAYRDVLRAQLQANEKVKVFLDTSASESQAMRDALNKAFQLVADLAAAGRPIAAAVHKLNEQHQELAQQHQQLRSSCEAVWRLG